MRNFRKDSEKRKENKRFYKNEFPEAKQFKSKKKEEEVVYPTAEERRNEAYDHKEAVQKNQIKFYRNLVEAVIVCLQKSFGDGIKVDQVIEKVLKSNSKWGSRDRAFIAETTYDIVRNWRLLWEVWDKEPFLSDKNMFSIIGLHYKLKGVSVPEWDEFQEIRLYQFKERFTKFQKVRKIRESIPDWMDEYGLKELGDKWEENLSKLNQQAEVVLRTNTLKISRPDFFNWLNQNGMEAELVEPLQDGVILRQRRNIFKLEAFQSGWFEMQDASSQMVGEFSGVKPGMRVIDACAGAGGKSLHLAALMQNKGKIVSMDIEQKKLDELKRRARRAGVSIIESRVIDNSKVIKRLENSADVLLLDVPCSGSGVIRRNPDAKWKLQPRFIDEVKRTQQQILQDYTKMLKSGGTLIYATCSIFPSENDAQVDSFLASNPEFSLVEKKTLLPAEFGFDGFFMAKMTKA